MNGARRRSGGAARGPVPRYTGLPALLPTTHAFAAGRELIDGGPMPWDEFALATVGTLVATAAALAFVAWMLRLFRRRGYVTRYS